MSFTQTIPEFINQVQPPVLPVSKVKIEAPMVIKTEPPESEMVEIGVDNILDSSESEEKIVPDKKDIDILWHPLCEDSIKSETVLEYLLETKHLESVETQAYVKIENSSFVKTENLHKTENTSDENESWGTGQGVVEVLGSNKHFNASGNLETDDQLVNNFSTDLKGIGTSSRKAIHPKKIDFAQCYKTDETTLWEKEQEIIKIIRACVSPVEPHEYTSLAKDKHVCNHCQQSSKTLKFLKVHIKRLHRKDTPMYQCPHCPYKSKWSMREHIILKHKDAKDIQWFQCHLCVKKFKLKYQLTVHMKKVHLTYELCLVCGNRCTHKKCKKRYCSEECAKKQQINYHCHKCNYKSYNIHHLKNHKLTHLKPEEIQYFYCYHCSHKNKQKEKLKQHIFRHFRSENVLFNCYVCDFVTQKRDLLIKHIRKHFKNPNKYDETISKYQLESRNLEKRYPCDQCDYITYERKNLQKHKLNHLNLDEIEYFHCYHCSFKSKYKDSLKYHISVHFRKGDVPFHCHICDFTTSKRDVIIKHFKKHPEHHSKCDEMKHKYQLETGTQKLKKRYHYCDKCDYKTFNTGHLKDHKMIHLKPEEIEYFYCYHCSVKSKYKQYIKCHILKHFRNETVPFKCYICEFMTLKRDKLIEHLKKHPEHHSKLDETKYK